MGNKQMGPNEVTESGIQYFYYILVCQKVINKISPRYRLAFFLQSRRYNNSKECPSFFLHLLTLDFHAFLYLVIFFFLFLFYCLD